MASTDDPLIAALVDQLQAMRQAERVSEADAVAAELEREIRDAGPVALVESGGLIGGIFRKRLLACHDPFRVAG